jgi:hypothetical protein
VTRRVDGDHHETHLDQSGQGLRVEDTLGREAVHHDERNTLSRDGHSYGAAAR